METENALCPSASNRLELEKAEYSGSHHMLQKRDGSTWDLEPQN